MEQQQRQQNTGTAPAGLRQRFLLRRGVAATGAAAIMGAAAAILAVSGVPQAAAQLQLPAPTPSPSATPAPEVRFELHLTRLDVPPTTPAAGAAAAPAAAPATAPATSTPVGATPEAVLATPILTTLAGQTATMNVTGAEPSFSVSLSPSVEAANNSINSLQVLWNIRLSGKTLPGGVTGVTMTGATRVTPGQDAVIADILLTDPKTGGASRFRLGGRVNLKSEQKG